MKKVKPIYDEDYDICYIIPDYNGQTILEIGSDYGSTAYYFFGKGAKKVISIEENPALHKMALANKEEDENWTPICKKIENSEDLKELLFEHKPTLLHMDCELCETNLLDVPIEAFDGVEWLQIEIHNYAKLHNDFLLKFKDFGYTLIRDFIYEGRQCWITAWRKEK